MPDAECKHGLTERTCDACRPVTASEFHNAAGPLGAGARTIARYHGRCLACGEPIIPGDALVKTSDDGAWVHEGEEDG